MKKILFFIVYVFLYFNISFAQTTNWPLRDTVEFHPRKGLPNFFSKILSGDTTRVGFLGGSITYADGWRPKIIAWMKSYYQNDHVIPYNAGISATDSKFAVFRIDNHLFAKDDFDLIFVEFAVNDVTGTSKDVERSIEGIVRKIWNKNPKTDICFVYTLQNTFLTNINAGKMNHSASKHDSIASYYEIPSVFWGTECAKMLASDSVVFNDTTWNWKTDKNINNKWVFTSDNVHPTTFGYNVYANVLSRSFMKIESNVGEYNHEIKQALILDNYEWAKIIPVSDSNNYGMTVIDSVSQLSYLDSFIKRFGDRFLVSENIENYYTFSFNGKEFGLSTLYGPSTGYFDVEVDGSLLVTEWCFSSACNGYRYLPKFFKLSIDGEHIVKIRPSATKLSLARKEEVLTSAGKIDIQANPTKYEKNELIFSDIMVLGDIVSLPTLVKETVETLTLPILRLNNGILNIVGTNNIIYNVKIYDIKGLQLFTSEISQGKELSFRLPAKGIYLLKYVSENSLNTIKILNK